MQKPSSTFEKLFGDPNARKDKEGKRNVFGALLTLILFIKNAKTLRLEARPTFAMLFEFLIKSSRFLLRDCGTN
jgi:hypothetical protein